MRAIVVLMLAACGPVRPTTLVGSNTALICDGMIMCDSYTSFDASKWRVTDESRAACFKCLENYPDEVALEGVELRGPIDSCGEMRAIGQNIKQCIIERFYGER